MTTVAAVISWVAFLVILALIPGPRPEKADDQLSPSPSPPLVREIPSDNPGKRSFLINTFEELAGHELVSYLPFRYGDTLPDGSRCTGVGWSRITKYVWQVECCFFTLERGMLTRNEARQVNEMKNWE